MTNLENSMNFDYRLFPREEDNSPSPIHRFVNDIFPSLDIPAKHIKTVDKKKAIINILSNVIYAANQGKSVAFALNPHAYKLPQIYGMYHYSYSIMRCTMEALVKLSLINKHTGYKIRGDKNIPGRRTRLTESVGLRQSLSHYGHENGGFQPLAIFGNLDFQELEFTRIPYKRSLILKRQKQECKSKELMHYDMTPELQVISDQIDYYNQYISSCTIELVTEEQDPRLGSLPLSVTNKKYSDGSYSLFIDPYAYRVFSNGSFNEGGRFYCPAYQNLPEDIRCLIRLNGEPTVEVDYSSLHPRMLYHIKGIEFLDDPYTIKYVNSAMRPFVKDLMNMAINADKRTKALRALHKSMRYSIKSKNKQKKIELKQQFDSYNIKATELLDMIIHDHPTLTEDFFTGAWSYLQNLDSKIAHDILYDMAKQGKPCLCVHDSFIVRKSDQELLESLMVKYYRKHIGDFTVILKVNGKVKTYYSESIRISA